MTENKRTTWLNRGVQVDSRQTVWGVDLEDHARQSGYSAAGCFIHHSVNSVLRPSGSNRITQRLLSTADRRTS